VSTEREIKLPDIGDFESIDVIEVAVSPGDNIEQEDTLITLESDKATMDIPSPAAGIVKKVLVNVGDKVSQDAPIVILEETADNKQADAGSEDKELTINEKKAPSAEAEHKEVHG